MVYIGEGAAGGAVRLDGTEQEGGADGQAMLQARRIVLRVFVQDTVRAQPRADGVLFGQTAVEDGDLGL